MYFLLSTSCLLGDYSRTVSYRGKPYVSYYLRVVYFCFFCYTALDHSNTKHYKEKSVHHEVVGNSTSTNSKQHPLNGVEVAGLRQHAILKDIINKNTTKEYTMHILVISLAPHDIDDDPNLRVFAVNDLEKDCN